MYLVIRMKGQAGLRYDVEETFKRLHLHRKFSATIIPTTNPYLGMIKKISNYAIYGPVTPSLVKELLLKRGRLRGNKPLTEEHVKEKYGMGIDELADKLAKGELKLKELRELKPVFRLHPPRGGFKRSTKKLVSAGGELGYREDMEKLVLRML